MMAGLRLPELWILFSFSEEDFAFHKSPFAVLKELKVLGCVLDLLSIQIITAEPIFSPNFYPFLSFSSPQFLLKISCQQLTLENSQAFSSSVSSQGHFGRCSPLHADSPGCPFEGLALADQLWSKLTCSVVVEDAGRPVALRLVCVVSVFMQ